MAIKRYTINEHTGISFQEGDKVIDVHPGPEEGDGVWVVIERDVPDAPEYFPSMVGTATITNSYGVAIPNQHGVWVKTRDSMFFRLFEAKDASKAAFPERRVSNFVPDAGPDERLLSMAKERADATKEATKATRRAKAAEKALRATVDDMHNLIEGRDRPMVTALGATMQRWLTREGNA